jgi:hypothetical protein
MPANALSIPDTLNREFLKLERSIDSIIEGNPSAAIANDASGAANQATVNAILAALRATKIILP